MSTRRRVPQSGGGLQVQDKEKPPLAEENQEAQGNEDNGYNKANDLDFDPITDADAEDDDLDLFFDPVDGKDSNDDKVTIAIFTAVPAQSTTRILDYNTRAAITLYEGAVKALEEKLKLTS